MELENLPAILFFNSSFSVADAVLADMIKEYLGATVPKMPFEVARTWDEALGLLKKWEHRILFVLVEDHFCDYKGGGEHIVRWMRGMHMGFYIVAMWDSKGSRERMQLAGADDLLPKSFDIHDLDELVGRAARKYRQFPPNGEGTLH